jgi:hypothetical protein
MRDRDATEAEAIDTAASSALRDRHRASASRDRHRASASRDRHRAIGIAPSVSRGARRPPG